MPIWSTFFFVRNVSKCKATSTQSTWGRLWESLHCAYSLMLISTATWQPKRTTQSQSGWFSYIQIYITHNCRGGHNVLLLSKSHSATHLPFFQSILHASQKPNLSLQGWSHISFPQKECKTAQFKKNQGRHWGTGGGTTTPCFSLPYRHSNKTFNGQSCHSIYEF